MDANFSMTSHQWQMLNALRDICVTLCQGHSSDFSVKFCSITFSESPIAISSCKLTAVYRNHLFKCKTFVSKDLGGSEVKKNGKLNSRKGKFCKRTKALLSHLYDVTGIWELTEDYRALWWMLLSLLNERWPLGTSGDHVSWSWACTYPATTAADLTYCIYSW